MDGDPDVVDWHHARDKIPLYIEVSLKFVYKNFKQPPSGVSKWWQ